MAVKQTGGIQHHCRSQQDKPAAGQSWRVESWTDRRGDCRTRYADRSCSAVSRLVQRTDRRSGAEKSVGIDVCYTLSFGRNWKETLMADARTKEAVDILNRILEMELAGAIHYTHYSFMVFGFNRIPIVKWMEEQAVESMAHARAAGELITQLGAH